MSHCTRLDHFLTWAQPDFSPEFHMDSFHCISNETQHQIDQICMIFTRHLYYFYRAKKRLDMFFLSRSFLSLRLVLFLFYTSTN